MNTRIFTLLHAGIGAVLVVSSLFGATNVGNINDSNSVTLGLLLAFVFGLAAIGYWVRSRLLVAVPAVLILCVTGMFMLVMLFAAHAWGEANRQVIYTFQGVLLLVMVLEIAGLVVIFRKTPDGQPGQPG